MSSREEQEGWPYGSAPADWWQRENVKQALDELFRLTNQYRLSEDYVALLRFIGRFRTYAPYNAMLVHVQMPGACFVAPPSYWLYKFGRRITPGARPLVILRPMGPVMFVFDVSDTEALPDAPPLPREVEKPFEVLHGSIGEEPGLTIDNAKRDGVRIGKQNGGAQRAGSIHSVSTPAFLQFLTRSRPRKEYVSLPLRYELLVNSKLSPEARYATVAHELAHLYCGHLGTPNDKWWPDRLGLPKEVREFEAESVAFLLCQRLGINNPSAAYLTGYLGKHEEVPDISLQCVMKAAGLIEQMGRGRLGMREKK